MGMKRMLVFVTDDGMSPDGTGPILVLEERPEAVLPRHPRSLSWRYFATVGIEDGLLAADRPAIEAAHAAGRAYVSPRLIFVPCAASLTPSEQP